MNTPRDTDEVRARPSVWPVYVAAVVVLTVGVVFLYEGLLLCVLTSTGREAESLCFFHHSAQEYYAARFLEEELYHGKKDSVRAVLARKGLDPVRAFLKDLLEQRGHDHRVFPDFVRDIP